MFISGQDFDSYVMGGSLGRSKEEIDQVLEWTFPLLPEDKPWHLLGFGKIDEIFEVLKRGIYLFACVSSPCIPAAPKKVNQISSRLISRSLSWHTKNLSL